MEKGKNGVYSGQETCSQVNVNRRVIGQKLAKKVQRTGVNDRVRKKCPSGRTCPKVARMHKSETTKEREEQKRKSVRKRDGGTEESAKTQPGK